MFRKAPRLLALLASSICLLAKASGRSADRRHRLPRRRPDGRRDRPGLRLRPQPHRDRPDRGCGRRPRGQSGRHEPPPARRPRDLPDLFQQRDPEPRVPERVLRAPATARGPTPSRFWRARRRPSRSTRSAHVNVIVDPLQNQAPFGYIDIPGPAGLEGANGSFPVAGWAIDDVDIDRIDFLVDGRIVAGAVGRGEPSTAIYGTTRPDVAAAFPDVPLALYSRLLANIDTSQFINGIHVISVRATDTERRARGTSGSRRVQIVNTGAEPGALRPDRLPARQGLALLHRRSPAGSRRPARRTSAAPRSVNVVAGWALDVGSALDRGQVSFVELLLDGQIIANTRTDCTQIGGAADQLLRHQPARRGPQLLGLRQRRQRRLQLLLRPRPRHETRAARSSILTPQSSGLPVLTGFTMPGKHTLAIRVGDEEETVIQIGAISVDILCDVDTSDQPAFGYIDTPSDYQFISGVFEVFGWAFDFQVVQSHRGRRRRPRRRQRGLRPAPSGRPGERLPRRRHRHVGFSYFLDTTELSDSSHDLVIYVIDGRATGARSGGASSWSTTNVVPTPH